MDLVQLVLLPREEGVETQHLEEDAAHPPHIHRTAVVAIRQETLRGPVPSSGDVFGVGQFSMDAATTAEVSQLDFVVPQQDIFWFDVSMEDALHVHVFDGHNELVDPVLDLGLGQVALPALDGLVEVHIHQLEDQG